MTGNMVCSHCGSERRERCGAADRADARVAAIASRLGRYGEACVRCLDCGFIGVERGWSDRPAALAATGARRLLRRAAREAAYCAWRFDRDRRIREFHDRHRGKSCFVIGNGPSLKGMDLERLNGHYAFGVNHIYLLFDRIRLNLSYHVITDPRAVQVALLQLRAQAWPTFVGWDAGHEHLSDCSHVHFLRMLPSPNGRRVTDQALFNRDITHGMWDGGTVTYVALQLAFYMGFETVYLIGIEPTTRDQAEGPGLSAPMAHFDDRYPGFRRGPDSLAMEIAFRLAKYAYRSSGRRILDATVNSRLGVFETVSYEDALAASSPRES